MRENADTLPATSHCYVLRFSSVTHWVSCSQILLFILQTTTLSCLISACLSSFIKAIIYIWAHSPQVCLHHRNPHVDSQFDYCICTVNKSSRERHPSCAPCYEERGHPGVSCCLLLSLVEQLTWFCCHQVANSTHFITFSWTKYKYLFESVLTHKYTRTHLVKNVYFTVHSAQRLVVRTETYRHNVRSKHTNTEIQITSLSLVWIT